MNNRLVSLFFVLGVSASCLNASGYFDEQYSKETLIKSIHANSEQISTLERKVKALITENNELKQTNSVLADSMKKIIALVKVNNAKTTQDINKNSATVDSLASKINSFAYPTDSDILLLKKKIKALENKAEQKTIKLDIDEG